MRGKCPSCCAIASAPWVSFFNRSQASQDKEVMPAKKEPTCPTTESSRLTGTWAGKSVPRLILALFRTARSTTQEQLLQLLGLQERKKNKYGAPLHWAGLRSSTEKDTENSLRVGDFMVIARTRRRLGGASGCICLPNIIPVAWKGHRHSLRSSPECGLRFCLTVQRRVQRE